MEKKKSIRVVAAIIQRDNYIFATQRGYGDFKDGWEFPGGKIEEGESPEHAIAREIKEELNADIIVGDLLITVEHDYPNFHLSMDCFWAELAPDSKMELLEHEAAKWLSIDEIDTVDWLPADIKVVEAIKEWK
ncbi:8-oxo-dGTP diphosphatase [Ruminococcaceae bacterium YAD3003]|nr:8-oxo-dGTP diphosphatase [Ruminococcaceae bacterium YAD3003]